MLTANKRNKILDEYFPNLDSKIKDKLNEYYELIETENSKYNLTGFHDEILFKYGIIENVLIFQEIEKKIINLDNLNVLDIGAGAGFPSLPFLIFKNESFNLTIYEAQKKRCSFLQLVIDKLNIKNISIVNIRCENSIDYNKFDFITARAVSEFKNLVEISHKLGKMNSYFCFLKSKKYNLEIDNAKWIIKKLMLNVQVLRLNIFFDIENILLYFQKNKLTPEGIPREWKTIIKNNLN